MRSVNSFLDAANDGKNEIEEAIALFSMRSHKIKVAAQEIKTFQIADPYTPVIDDLVSSYIHLFLNRVLLSNQRKHELVIYHFLHKYYDSQIAITKKQFQTV